MKLKDISISNDVLVREELLSSVSGDFYVAPDENNNAETDHVVNVDRKFVMPDGSLSDFFTEYPPANGTVVLDTTLSNCASQELADALWPFLSSKVFPA